MTESQQLLRDYVANGSEAAFRELLAHYLNLVHSAAVRLVNGDRHLADDVAQTVFVDFARLAKTLPRKVQVGGWLYTHTCLVASSVMRGERRRLERERKVVEMNSIEDHTDANLAQITPVLDEAMNKLAIEDRSAILLRFFERMDFRSVGEAIGTSEEAAKKRVSRALDKLRDLLVARGVTLSSAALAAALTAEALKAAPAALLAAIAPVALSGGAASIGAALTLVRFTTTSKVAVGVASAIVVAGVAFTAKQYQAQGKLRDDNLALRQQTEQLMTEAESLSNQVASLTVGKAAADNQLQELSRLRGEVGLLRKQVKEAAAERVVKAEAPPQNKPADPQEQDQQFGIRKMRDAKIWLYTFLKYSWDHQGQLPSDFEQVTNHLNQALRGDLNPGDVMRDPAEFADSANQFEILYKGSINNFTNGATMLVMREKEAWQSVNGAWNRTYGFADGHTEIHHADNGNFAPWEAQHLPAEPSP
jgi:RNA polymerase sigma factor (sigma-70 family)